MKCKCRKNTCTIHKGSQRGTLREAAREHALFEAALVGVQRQNSTTTIMVDTRGNQEDLVVKLPYIDDKLREKQEEDYYR